MIVKLKWAVQNQASERGVVSEETWKAISRVSSIFRVTPEDVASAWLDGVHHQHRYYTINVAGTGVRLETVKLSASVWAALDRLWLRECPEATLSDFLEQLFHERFFADDPVYAQDWMRDERVRFEAEILGRERRRLQAKREARR